MIFCLFSVLVYEYYHQHLLEGALLLLASSIGMAVYLNVDLGVSKHNRMMVGRERRLKYTLETFIG